MHAPNYNAYLNGDPSAFKLKPPIIEEPIFPSVHGAGTAGDVNAADGIPTDESFRSKNVFLHHLVHLASQEIAKNEHLLHNAILFPAIQQFAYILRPWLVFLTLIFLIMLIVGIIQLILLTWQIRRLAQKKVRQLDTVTL